MSFQKVKYDWNKKELISYLKGARYKNLDIERIPCMKWNTGRQKLIGNYLGIGIQTDYS